MRRSEPIDRIKILHVALTQICTKNVSALSYEQAYRHCYWIVVNGQGRELYTAITNVVISHIQGIENRLFQKIGNNFLEEMVIEWEDHVLCSSLINDICMYLNASYIFNEKLLDLYNMSMNLFKEQIIFNDTIQNLIRNIMLGMIASQRNGIVINIPTLKSACDMLLHLNSNNRELYEQVFEDSFFAQSQIFYEIEAQKCLEQGDAVAYVSAVENRIMEERERLKRYLDKGSDRVIDIVEETMIRSNLTKIIELEEGLKEMLRNQKHYLKILYKWFLKYYERGATVLIKVISKILKEEGEVLVLARNPNFSISFIQDLLDLRDKYIDYQKNYFENNEEFLTEITTNFAHFVNLNGKFPEYLARYMHNILVKSSKEVDIGQTNEVVIQKALLLFKNLNDKDIFERCYKVLLANRILEKKFITQEIEKNVILKIKAECGSDFTSNLESMIKDQDIFIQNMKEFEKYIQENNIYLSGIKIFIATIPTIYWPIPTPVPICVLPFVLQNNLTIFEQFYINKYNKKKLTLHPLKGSALIQAAFKIKNKSVWKEFQLEVSTYQVCVIMLFNKQLSWTFEEIQNETKINCNHLSTVMQSLVEPYKLLLRKSVTKETEDKNIYSLNEMFTSKSTRIKLISKLSKDVKQLEQIKILENLTSHRKYFLEAVIVRIMKTRQSIKYNNLLSEVMEQSASNFKPDFNFIRSCIRDLISRKYMKENTVKKTYEYVA